MTDAAEILQMNIQRFEHLLKRPQDEPKRRQIAKLLAEARVELLRVGKESAPGH